MSHTETAWKEAAEPQIDFKNGFSGCQNPRTWGQMLWSTAINNDSINTATIKDT